MGQTGHETEHGLGGGGVPDNKIGWTDSLTFDFVDRQLAESTGPVAIEFKESASERGDVCRGGRVRTEQNDPTSL